MTDKVKELEVEKCIRCDNIEAIESYFGGICSQCRTKTNGSKYPHGTNSMSEYFAEIKRKQKEWYSR